MLLSVKPTNVIHQSPKHTHGAEYIVLHAKPIIVWSAMDLFSFNFILQSTSERQPGYFEVRY